MNGLIATDLDVRYGALHALRKVSLTAHSGHMTAILGRNGAGKTTLLHALIGAVSAAGRVFFDGEDISRLDTRARVAKGLSLCPEGRQIFPRMTVLDNLRMGGYLLPKKELNTRTEEMLARFPMLAPRLNQLAGTLSGGEQQWLAAARSLMAHPKLLLLDEPTLGLSPEAARELLDFLHSLTQGGLTTIVVEQDVRGILRIADDVYIMRSGECSARYDAKQLTREEDLRILLPNDY